MGIDELFDRLWGPIGTPERDAIEAEADKLRRRSKRAERLTGWMARIPVVGPVVATFWYGLLDEGLTSTCQPVWGLMSFHFLNDGMHPTLWHCWQQIAHHNGRYSGIWVSGAPSNQADAERKLAEAA
jgi:hypothetical protein